MNILHITTFLQGGAGRIIKDLACHQKKSGNKVFVITTSSEEDEYCNYSEYIETLKDNNIKVYKVDSTFKRDIYLNLNVVSKVRKIIINENIDIIHAHAAVPAMVGIIAKSGMNRYIPVIQTMHGWGTNKKPEHEKMDVTIMNGIDKIISVSKSDKELMISKGINENKILTIYNGIEDKANYDLIAAEDEIEKDTTAYKNEGYTVLGCIGSVCKRKNQELLIDAINKMHKDIKIYVVIIGEGDLISTLKEKVDTYGIENKIKFYGYRNNASKYINLFDYLIFTSISEGFSIALLEGLRERVPIIASNIPAFCECIENNKTGYLFENDNSQSLSIVIKDVIDNNIDDFVISNGYKKFINQFTLKKMLKKYDILYKNL